MDRELERNLEEMIKHLKEWSVEDVDTAVLDPMAKMMLVALLHETRKIKDSIESLSDRIADRFCDNFIPRKNVSAIPALAVMSPKSSLSHGPVVIDSNASFLYKPPVGKPLNYIPLFKNVVIPVDGVYWMTSEKFHTPQNNRSLPEHRVQPNVLWLGLNASVEIECLKGFSLLFRNTVAPVRISVGDSGHTLNFATMNRMEDIDMVEPFDSQQASNCMFSILQEWREAQLHMPDASLIYLTDPIKDRDLFKPKHHPSIFQFCLLSEEIDAIPEGTIWLKVEFPEGYKISEKCNVVVNAFPVVNVDVDHVMLTASSPIAKLQKQDNTFFLTVLNTSNQSRKEGFDIEEDEYLIRDFDASCYHNGDLYRDVRNLYHHFVEDYYAFMEYNGIKDGEVINQLRETLNKIGKSVGNRNAKYQFDSGVYAMRNINRNPLPASIKVAFLTTRGKEGNQPREDEVMENKKCPGLGKEIQVVVDASCGRDKASADERYEQLRYYALTQDRLYTKMDIDAFLRKEIMAEFGPEEFKRISIRISIEGAGGTTSLQRGLYIDIEFKDKKNYEKAKAESFGILMKQKIENKSCISMPIIVELINQDR